MSRSIYTWSLFIYNIHTVVSSLKDVRASITQVFRTKRYYTIYMNKYTPKKKYKNSQSAIRLIAVICPAWLSFSSRKLAALFSSIRNLENNFQQRANVWSWVWRWGDPVCRGLLTLYFLEGPGPPLLSKKKMVEKKWKREKKRKRTKKRKKKNWCEGCLWICRGP